MLHAGVYGRRDQRMARDRIVAIIVERLLDAFRHHDRSREMHDRSDALLSEDSLDQSAVVDPAFIEGHVLRDDIAVAGRKVVDDGDAPAGIA